MGCSCATAWGPPPRRWCFHPGPRASAVSSAAGTAAASLPRPWHGLPHSLGRGGDSRGWTGRKEAPSSVRGSNPWVDGASLGCTEGDPQSSTVCIVCGTGAQHHGSCGTGCSGVGSGSAPGPQGSFSPAARGRHARSSSSHRQGCRADLGEWELRAWLLVHCSACGLCRTQAKAPSARCAPRHPSHCSCGNGCRASEVGILQRVPAQGVGSGTGAAGAQQGAQVKLSWRSASVCNLVCSVFSSVRGRRVAGKICSWLIESVFPDWVPPGFVICSSPWNPGVG